MPVTIGETGRVSISSTIDSDSSSPVAVPFNNMYTNPVVVTYIPSRSGSQSIVSRARSVGSTGCEIFMEEPDDQSHNVEDVCYMVVEAGSHTIDGVRIEAGVVNTEKGWVDGGMDDWAYRSYPTNFSNRPAVLTGVMTYNNADFMASYARGAYKGGCDVGLMAADSGSVVSEESLGWIAFESGSGTINGVSYEAGIASDGSADGADDSGHTISFNNSYSAKPDICVTLSSLNDSEGAWARGEGTWSTSQHTVYAEETTITDGERNHADEEFSWVAFEENAQLTYPTRGTTKIQTENGAIEIPLYKPTDPPNAMVRFQTPSGPGAVNLKPAGSASDSYLRVQTASGTMGLDDRPFLPQIYSLSDGTISLSSDFSNGLGDWSIHSGTWNTNNGTLTNTSSNNYDVAYAPTNVTHGTWQFDFRQGQGNYGGWTVLVSPTDAWDGSSSYSFLYFNSNDNYNRSFQVSDSSGNLTRLVTMQSQSDEGWHTYKFTRGADDTWEAFSDGVSDGTAVDSTWQNNTKVYTRSSGQPNSYDNFTISQ